MTLDLKHEVRSTTWDTKNALPSQNQPMTKATLLKNFTVVACEVYELEFLFRFQVIVRLIFY
jgi:hypothetical protein